MIHSGLCSIAFRRRRAEEIVGLVMRAGLDGIEWGGDAHAPHGDLARARQIGRMTRDVGIRVSSYGSYYRVVQSELERLPFERVLETAVELGAPAIRVWAGVHASTDAKESYRCKVAEEARRIAVMAAAESVAVSFEFHGNTLTDTNASACALLEETAHPNIGSYWRPTVGRSMIYRLEGLRDLLPWLTNLHVFHWRGGRTGVERLPLAEGEVEWTRYLDRANEAPGDRYALLEFVRDDAPEQFLRDARVLRQWLTG
jgi:sugar phosphate isomerase/epimerase